MREDGLAYLSLPARTALAGLAERLFTDEQVPLLADDDYSPLRLDDVTLGCLTARELRDAQTDGAVWEDGGEFYLSEDVLPSLTGHRASFLVPAGFLVFVGDDVMFESEDVRHHGWVVSISEHPFFYVHADDGSDWSVGAEAIKSSTRAEG